MMRNILSAALISGALFFTVGAHADDRGSRSWSSERHHYDRDYDRDHGKYDRKYDRRDNHRWNSRDRGYRDYRSDYRPRYVPPRYYWRQNSRWYYGAVPRGYRGDYYSYRPRDSYGRVIISLPLF